MSETNRSEPDSTNDADVNALSVAFARVGKLIFPFLPPLVQIAAIVLAVATVAAAGIAWYGNNVDSGVGLALFVSIMMVAFTISSACLIRIVYDWLERTDWTQGDRERDFTVVVATIGAHVPLLALSIVNQSIAAQYHVLYSGVATVALIGALLWILHEALRAKKVYDLAPRSNIRRDDD